MDSSPTNRPVVVAVVAVVAPDIVIAGEVVIACVAVLDAAEFIEVVAPAVVAPVVVALAVVSSVPVFWQYFICNFLREDSVKFLA